MLMGKDLLVGVSLLLALFFGMNQQCLRTASVYSSKALTALRVTTFLQAKKIPNRVICWGFLE